MSKPKIIKIIKILKLYASSHYIYLSFLILNELVFERAKKSSIILECSKSGTVHQLFKTSKLNFPSNSQ